MPGAPRTNHALLARQAAAHASWITRLVEEACNQGNLAIFDEVVAPAPGAGVAGTPAPLLLRQQLAAFRAAVPDARWTIVQLVAAGDTVVARLAVRGTFSGPLVGLTPPGRAATLAGVAIGRFSAEQLVELWLQADLLGFLQQLGVLPPLRLAQVVTLAQVLRVDAQLAEERAAAAPRAPPRGAERQQPALTILFPCAVARATGPRAKQHMKSRAMSRQPSRIAITVTLLLANCCGWRSVERNWR